jgi:cytoskeletal protein CcmA (bactofilin family)
LFFSGIDDAELSRLLLDVKRNPDDMSSTLSKATESNGASASNRSPTDPFDPQLHFDRWLDDLQGGQKPLTPEAPETEQQEDSGIYIGSFPGSNCEVSFEGVLHFDGYSIVNISSPEGTLVLTKRGRIEADINVGIAIINGSVTGNIRATERVVLESEARVSGQIRTPALSVRLGAVFDGECLFTGAAEPVAFGEVSRRDQSEEVEQLAVGASV